MTLSIKDIEPFHFRNIQSALKTVLPITNVRVILEF